METGNYQFKITDEFDNSSTYEFSIISSPQQYFSYSLPTGFSFVEVRDENELYETDETSLSLKTDGNYSISYVEDSSMDKHELDVEIDTIPPIVQLLGVSNGGETEGEVKVICEEEGVKVNLIKDGDEIDYVLGKLITSDGAFQISVSDSAGNITNYTFNRTWTLNTAGMVALIVITVIITWVVFEIIRNRKIKIK